MTNFCSKRGHILKNQHPTSVQAHIFQNPNVKFQFGRAGLSRLRFGVLEGYNPTTMVARSKGLALVLILYCVFLANIPGLKSETEGVLKVAATIFPVADIVKQVGGTRVQVLTVLPRGGNPHVFELTPKLVKNLEQAKTVFAVGHRFDDWVKGIGESLPGVRVVTVDQGIPLIQTDTTDPHYWLSISNAKQMARNICSTLIELDPEQKDVYVHNLESYLSKLDQTDQHLREMFAKLGNKKIVTYHDGWRYFARDYGFEVIGNIESSEGVEPTPRKLAELSKSVKRFQTKALFSEPEVPKDIARSFAEDLGLNVYELDPLGKTLEGGTYLDLMIKNANVMCEALQNG